MTIDRRAFIAAGSHQGFDGYCGSQMPDLLPLRLRAPGVVLPRLFPPARGVCRAHIIDPVRASQLKGADVLDDPTLADAVDRLVADDTDAARAFPRLQPTVS